jgi:hypothetical protein
MASSQRDEPGVRMRRELNVWEAIGISVALMAPSFAINANPQGMVGAVGRSVPLGFLLATIGVVLIGAMRFLWASGKARVPLYEIIVPIGALAVIGYVIYRQMDPDGKGASSLWNTSLGLIVPAVGIFGALLLPGFASNFGRHLREEEGLASAVPASGD